MKPFLKYEIVKVETDDSEFEDINNTEVTIREVYEDENGTPYYAIITYDGLWGITHRYLKSTGKFDKEENYYSGAKAIISLDGKLKQYIEDE